jgi:hypothetical protein
MTVRFCDICGCKIDDKPRKIWLSEGYCEAMVLAEVEACQRCAENITERMKNILSGPKFVAPESAEIETTVQAPQPETAASEPTA